MPVCACAGAPCDRFSQNRFIISQIFKKIYPPVRAKVLVLRQLEAGALFRALAYGKTIKSAHENHSSHLMTHWKALLRAVSLLCGLTQPTPADTFLLREKYPKAYQRGSVLFDISSGGSIPRGCRQAAKPPPLVKNFRDRRGARDRSAVTAGHSPQGYLRGVPLDTFLGTFIVK